MFLSLNIFETIIAIWLIAINLIAFITFGMDKRAAVLGRWRTPEKTLIGLCAVGGAFGGYLAMRIFHHKTQKLKFKLCVPFFMLEYVVVIGAQMFL